MKQELLNKLEGLLPTSVRASLRNYDRGEHITSIKLHPTYRGLIIFRERI